MKKIYLFASLVAACSGSIAQSEAELKQKLQTNPNDAKTSFALGEWIRNEKRYAEASPYFAHACRVDTNNSEYPFQYGYMYQYLVKNQDSAMYWYRISGRRYTRNKENYYNNAWKALVELSGNAYNADYFIEAYENYAKITTPGFSDEEKYKMLKGLRDNPSADGYIKLGDDLTKKLQFNEKWDAYMARFTSGVNVYDKALKLDPTKKPAIDAKVAAGLKEIAYSYFQDGYFEDALAKYNEALKYTQKDPEIFSAIGFIKSEKLKTPDYASALANYQKALSLTTAAMAKKDIFENIGLCYEKQKDYKNAIVYYEKGIATEPNFAKSIHFKLARVYDATGNVEKAKYHRLRS